MIKENKENLAIKKNSLMKELNWNELILEDKFRLIEKASFISILANIF